jgi:hypothetical protein
MSGPRRVERAIQAALDGLDGPRGFTIRDLAILIYGAAEKRHMVATHRAANRLFGRRPDAYAARLQPRRCLLWRPDR